MSIHTDTKDLIDLLDSVNANLARRLTHFEQEVAAAKTQDHLTRAQKHLDSAFVIKSRLATFMMELEYGERKPANIPIQPLAADIVPRMIPEREEHPDARCDECHDLQHISSGEGWVFNEQYYHDTKTNRILCPKCAVDVLQGIEVLETEDDGKASPPA